ncbi:unnamed protein product [Trichobilharzia regenti]|nr:unnamed protein product [Trichobilharzia regenti]
MKTESLKAITLGKKLSMLGDDFEDHMKEINGCNTMRHVRHGTNNQLHIHRNDQDGETEVSFYHYYYCYQCSSE